MTGRTNAHHRFASRNIALDDVQLVRRQGPTAGADEKHIGVVHHVQTWKTGLALFIQEDERHAKVLAKLFPSEPGQRRRRLIFVFTEQNNNVPPLVVGKTKFSPAEKIN